MLIFGWWEKKGKSYKIDPLIRFIFGVFSDDFLIYRMDL